MPATVAPAPPRPQKLEPFKAEADGDLMANLDAQFGVEPEAKSPVAIKDETKKAPEAKAEEKTKVEDKPEPKKEEEKEPTVDDLLKLPEKKTEAKKEEEEPKGGPKELREQLKTLRAELETARGELTKAKTTPQTSNGELDSIRKENEALKKQLDEKESRLRIADYSASEEFTNKYQKPFDDYASRVAKEIGQFAVETDEGMRPATAADFNELLRLNSAEAAKVANAKFGAAAVEILAHRRELIRLNELKTTELEKKRGEAAEFTKNQQKAHEEYTAKVRNDFTTRFTSRFSEFPDLVNSTDDPEATKALESGKQLAEIAFLLRAPDLPPEKRVQIQAETATRAALLGPALHRLNQREARIAELEARVKELEGTDPQKLGQRGNENGDSKPKSEGGLLENLDAYLAELPARR